MSYFENGCTPNPFNYITPAYSCPVQYQGIQSPIFRSNGKYIQVCAESDADIVYYTFTTNLGGIDHSAVNAGLYGGVYKYISKEGGDGPLVSHNLHGTFYDYVPGNTLTGFSFWRYLGLITGNTTITGTSPQTFSVLNKTGVTYYWYSSNNNILISSGGNTNAVTITPAHSGTAVLTLRLSSSCGTYIEQSVTLNITTNICLEGTYVDSSNSTYNLNTSQSVKTGGVTTTVTCPSANSYTWQSTSGTIPIYSSNNQLSFTMTSGGSLSVTVTAKNGSTTLATRNLTYYNFGSFMAFPNPANSSLSIAVTEDQTFSVAVYDQNGNALKLMDNFNALSILDTSLIPAGTYYLQVHHEGKLVNKQKIKIEH